MSNEEIDGDTEVNMDYNYGVKKSGDVVMEQKLGGYTYRKAPHQFYYNCNNPNFIHRV